jgi:hypothetical protein
MILNAEGYSDTWDSDDFVIDSPDRMHILRRQFSFRRVAPRANDVHCDTFNSAHIDAEFALARARDALGAAKGQTIWDNTTLIDRRGAQPESANSFSLAECWLAIAAQEGNGPAQAAITSLYRDGHGVPRDPAAAFLWATRSAEQHDSSGELLLAELYRSGTGTGADAGKADYWLAWSGLLPPPTPEEYSRKRRIGDGMRNVINGLSGISEGLSDGACARDGNVSLNCKPQPSH